MRSEKIAGILGGIVAVLVLVAAFYSTFGQRKLSPAAQPEAKAPINAPPAVKGPVVREVPQ